LFVISTIEFYSCPGYSFLQRSLYFFFLFHTHTLIPPSQEPRPVTTRILINFPGRLSFAAGFRPTTLKRPFSRTAQLPRRLFPPLFPFFSLSVRLPHFFFLLLPNEPPEIPPPLLFFGPTSNFFSLRTIRVILAYFY